MEFQICYLINVFFVESNINDNKIHFVNEISSVVKINKSFI